MDLLDDLLYVGIVGSRRRNSDEDYRLVREKFFELWEPDRTVIVSGGCPEGGDRFAEMIAAELGLPRQTLLSGVPDAQVSGPRIRIHLPHHKAFMETDPRWRSTVANYARNGLIARDARDALIACVAPDRSGGTEDTIKKFRRIHRKRETLT